MVRPHGAARFGGVGARRPAATAVLTRGWPACHCTPDLPDTTPPLQDSLPAGLKDYAGAFWMLGLAGLSLLGAALLHSLAPRLNKPFVGHIE